MKSAWLSAAVDLAILAAIIFFFLWAEKSLAGAPARRGAPRRGARRRRDAPQPPVNTLCLDAELDPVVRLHNALGRTATTMEPAAAARAAAACEALPPTPRGARVASQTNPLDWYECQAQAPAATTPTRRRRLTSAEPDPEELRASRRASR